MTFYKVELINSVVEGGGESEIHERVNVLLECVEKERKGK